MENYEFVCQIGKGNFGRISKIIRKSDKKTLIWKELDYGQMSEKEKEQIVSEVNILRELKHPNIVRYYDRIIDKKHSRIYIIMEYCEGGDLNQLIKRCKKTGEFIAEDIIWKIFTQVLLAIHVIHNHKEGKILHRDIKPSNIFLDKDNNVKLGDFGLSRELSDQSKFAYSHVGTPYYMSPEQIDETKYNEKSDIWSLGCFLYELTTFHPPFEAKNQIMLAMRIKSGKVEKINKRYSEELWRVITWMLTVNYNNRPSSEDLLNIPEVCIRLREKRIKDTLYKLKLFEEKLNIRDKEQKQKEDSLNEKEKNLKIKENELKEKENELKEKENELKDKENELKEKEKKFKNLSTLSNATTTGYSNKFLSSKNSNDLNNMNNSNNNSNSNNNYMSNNIDVYSIKNNIIKNMLDNNNDLNSLLRYSTKNNSSNSHNNSNSNNLLITANTNTSLNNISLLNNNNNSLSGINSMNNNNYLIKSNLNEDNKIESQNNIKRLSDEYPNHNFDTNSKNNYIHYSTNNIYSDYLNNKFKTSNKSISDNLNFNESEIKSEYTNIKNNLNSSNISNSNNNSIKKNNNGGSLINSLKKKISNSFINDENNYVNLLNKEKQKYDNITKEEKIIDSNKQTNSFAKKLNEYENSNKKNNDNIETNLSNINLNRTMKFNIKGNNILAENDIDEINKNNNNININNVKSEKNLNLFGESDNYTNIISQINNINTKYGIPSKISFISKNNSYKNKNLYEISNNDNINSNNNEVINSINNFNPNLLNKSNKYISSNKSINNNNLTSVSNNEKNNTKVKTVKNTSRGVNNLYKYNSNTNTNCSAYDFEIANKIGYDTGRPSTHCGIIETFSNNENNNNTTINNVNRNNIITKENRINSLRNNVKRARTPKINKIPARCFDNVTPLKYSNNDNNEEINNNNNNRVEKIDYGTNNYLSNLNQNNRTMINNTNINNINNNLKRLYSKQFDSKTPDKSKTINNSCRNKPGNINNYRKKK